MIRQADIDAIVDRITKTPMAPGDRVRMLEHPGDLSLDESRRLYRDVDFGDLIPVSKKRHCDIGWTDHAEYRAELRDSEPDQVNEQVCSRIFDRHFNPLSPKRKPADREKMKMQLPSGTAVVDYDATVEPFRADIVTTWRGAKDVANEILAISRLLRAGSFSGDMRKLQQRLADISDASVSDMTKDIEDIADDCEALQEECENSLENLSERAQEGEAGEKWQSRIEGCQEIVEYLREALDELKELQPEQLKAFAHKVKENTKYTGE